MTDRLTLELPIQQRREKNRAKNSRAVFAAPLGAAWSDNYQWGNRMTFSPAPLFELQCR